MYSFISQLFSLVPKARHEELRALLDKSGAKEYEANSLIDRAELDAAIDPIAFENDYRRKLIENALSHLRLVIPITESIDFQDGPRHCKVLRVSFFFASGEV